MFTKRFKTRKCCYVYDVNTNQILKIPVLVYKMLGDWDKYQQTEILEKYLVNHTLKAVKHAVKLIRDIQEVEGFLKPKTVKNIGHNITKDVLKNMLQNKLNKLVLNLTDNCNLNCNYCMRSSILCPPSSDMPLEIAFEAINYLYEHGKESKGPVEISFYGGEPLLNFEVLKKTVEYAESKFGKSGINFILASNGVILEQGEIDYLFTHDFLINISLDGPKHIHDKHRITLTGKGSYDSVIDNLKKLSKRYGKKSKEKLGILITLTPPYNIDEIVSFLNGEQWIAKHFKLRINEVFQHDHFKQKFGNNDATERRRNIYSKLYLKYKNSIINKNFELPTVCNELFESSFAKIYNRTLYTYPHKIYPLNGCCIPGLCNLFVGCNGELKTCEKTRGASDIGSLTDGIDTEAVWNLMEDYSKKSISSCKNCWAIGLCSICFVKSYLEGKFSSEHKKTACKAERAQLLRTLKEFCSITEKTPDAFTHLETNNDA
jgi:uncharacterized protein